MRCEAGHCLPEGRADGKRCLASETPTLAHPATSSKLSAPHRAEVEGAEGKRFRRVPASEGCRKSRAAAKRASRAKRVPRSFFGKHKACYLSIECCARTSDAGQAWPV